MSNPIHHGHAMFQDNRGNGTMLPAWYAAMYHAGEWDQIDAQHDPKQCADLANYRAIAAMIQDVKSPACDMHPEEGWGWTTGVDFTLSTLGAYNGMPHEYQSVRRRLEWFADTYGSWGV